MKKPIVCLILIMLLVSGCEKHSDNVISYESLEEETLNESSEESKIDPETVYEFLTSKYFITAKTESMGNIYNYVYYFDKGMVAGTKTISVFQNASTAKAYLDEIIEDCPHAFLEDNTVTAFYGKDADAFYQGYSLEKMKFALEKMGYEYIIEFDEKEFYKEFPNKTNPRNIPTNAKT